MTGPLLTAALLTPDDFQTIRKTVSCFASQSVVANIELLVLAPDPARVRFEPADVQAFHSVRVIDADLSLDTGHARATAVREASAPIIVFGEDHCFPEPGWAAALLAAHEGPWTAVGPVVRNANPGTLVSWADLLKGYGPWLAPGKSGELDHLPGHNSSYKVSALLPLGDDLGPLMEMETTLHWRLRAGGSRLFQEAKAQVAHTNFEKWGTWIPVSYHAGRVFAATRARSWSFPKRLAFAVATPLVPLVRMWRHMRQAIVAGLPGGLIVRVAPVLLIGLILDGVGQLVGCLGGPGNSSATLVQWDFHRNAPRDRTQMIPAR